MIRKGQVRWLPKNDTFGRVAFIARLFGVAVAASRSAAAIFRIFRSELRQHFHALDYAPLVPNTAYPKTSVCGTGATLTIVSRGLPNSPADQAIEPSSNQRDVQRTWLLQVKACQTARTPCSTIAGSFRETPQRYAST